MDLHVTSLSSSRSSKENLVTDASLEVLENGQQATAFSVEAAPEKKVETSLPTKPPDHSLRALQQKFIDAVQTRRPNLQAERILQREALANKLRTEWYVSQATARNPSTISW